MKFEQVSNTQKEIDEVSDLELADNFERERALEISEEIIKSIDKIKNTNIFNEEFIDTEDLVFFDIKNKYKPHHKFKEGSVTKTSEDEYVLDDFLRGKKTNFVGIHTKKDFEEFMESGLEEKNVFDIYFFNKSLTYDEFVTHELAHGLFDRKYKDEYGKYENEDEISDVSDEYREKIKDIIILLVKNKYQSLTMKNFVFNRQQIAEIFAYLYEREFCRRSADNVEMHTELDKKIEKFGKNPEKFIDKINKQDNKNFNLINNVYAVSHTLSFIVAKLLEDKYPDFEERMNIFENPSIV